MPTPPRLPPPQWRASRAGSSSPKAAATPASCAARSMQRATTCASQPPDHSREIHPVAYRKSHDVTGGVRTGDLLLGRCPHPTHFTWPLRIRTGRLVPKTRRPRSASFLPPRIERRSTWLYKHTATPGHATICPCAAATSVHNRDPCKCPFEARIPEQGIQAPGSRISISPRLARRAAARLSLEDCIAQEGSIFGRVIRVGNRNPTIVVSIFSHVPDAREVHVGERDQVAVFRRISKHPFPPNRGELLINVEFNRDRRGIELHVRSVNRVAQENQLFTVVLERVKSLAGRMSIGGNSVNLGKQLGRPIKSSYLVGGYVRTHCLFDGLKEAF